MKPKPVERYLTRRATAAVALVTVFSLLAPADAVADRALLIGVGVYQDDRANMPGIDRDLQRMTEVATTLGYGQIRVLRDGDATFAAVEAALGRWLVEGVDPGERVLIYYTGHGSRTWDANGDEVDDRADEVLMLHDTRVVVHAGRQHLERALVDDRLGEMLAGIPSRKVLLLIDACHSGSATKEFDWRRGLHMLFGGKFFSYLGMPDVSGDGLLDTVDAHETVNYVALSASNDNEEALYSEQGSLFTRGVYEAVMRTGGHLTPRELHAEVSDYVLRQVSRGERFHPQISGDYRLANLPMLPSGRRAGR